MSVNLPFPTHHSSISLCFHHLHHATCNSPAFKSTILSSRWSPQFTHWQTCTCPLSKGVGRGHQGEWYLPVEPLCTYYCQLCTFLCFWCALEHIQSKRERQHSILTGPVFCAWHFRQMWEPTAFCENHVKLVHMMGSSSAQGDTRMSYCDVLQCTFLWSPVYFSLISSVSTLLKTHFIRRRLLRRHLKRSASHVWLLASANIETHLLLMKLSNCLAWKQLHYLHCTYAACVYLPADPETSCCRWGSYLSSLRCWIPRYVSLRIWENSLKYPNVHYTEGEL